MALQQVSSLPAQPASALAIHPREIQTLRLHNHDTGSYETLYEVDSCSSDVVIFWTMTGTHVVPDSSIFTHQLHLTKHQHHTHQADMILGVSISYLTALSTSILRFPAHPASALTIHPRDTSSVIT